MVSEAIRSLKRKYKNQGGEKIGRDLIQPCLKEAIKYRRGTGTFSSSAFKAYVGAIDHFINDNVKIEILCSPKIDFNLLKVLEKCNSETDRDKILQKTTNEILLAAAGCKAQPERPDYRSLLIAYLIAKGKLEIKIALPLNNSAIQVFDSPEDQELDMDNINTRAMYHIKYGYFVFPDDSVVAFEGSVNETDTALNFNTEKATVYRSWVDADKERLDDVVEDLDNDWYGNNNDIRIYSIDNDSLKIIRDQAPSARPQPQKKQTTESQSQGNEDNSRVVNSELDLWPHQVSALSAWKNNAYKGILAMATGSGKTRTAINAIVSFRNKVPSGFVIIVVPYQPLALQWIKEINELTDIQPIAAFKTHTNWYSELKNECLNALYKKTKAPCIVAVDDTFNSDRFQELLGDLEKAIEKNHMIVSDECHHYNKSEQIKKLPEFFSYRLGLSATPYDQFDESNQNKFLETYFDKIVYTYSLSEAIQAGYLCPYEYHVIEVNLNDEETDMYEELSKKIGKAKAISDSAQGDSKGLDALLSERSRLIGNIEDKLIKFESKIKDGIESFTLVYSGDGSKEFEDLADQEKIKQIEQITSLLNKRGWNVGRITASETLEQRENTIDAFKRKLLDVIVSIRILDEGIDIPACRTAYILASKRSERVFIQRRGRVLRKSPGKDKAIIYDFVIVGAARQSDYSDRLVKSELQRVWNFSNDAINGNEIKTHFSLLADKVKLFEEEANDRS